VCSLIIINNCNNDNNNRQINCTSEWLSILMWSHRTFGFLQIVCELEQKQFIMVNIYANDTIRNRTLFKNVEDRICRLNLKFSEAKVLWGGDFNTVFDDNLDR